MDSKEILFRKEGEKYVPVSYGEGVVSIEKAVECFDYFLIYLREGGRFYPSSEYVEHYISVFKQKLSE